MLYGCTIYPAPHPRFQHSSLCISPLGFLSSGAAASCLNPCSTVARHKRFLTLVSRFCPFACWPPSQPPSYAFHPHHGPPILRSHDTRGSRHRFQGPSLCFLAALLPQAFLRLPPTSLLAFINAFPSRLHVTRGSRHRFQPRSFALGQLDHHPAPSFTQAFILARPKLRRRPDASPSPGSPDHDLHYQYPTHELEFGLWVVTAWSFPSPPGRVPRRGWQDISLKA